MRYVDLVAGTAAHGGDRVAVVGSGRRMTFSELDDRVARLGQALGERGLRPGDRVALLATNEPEYIEIQAACLRAGFTLVPLNTRLAERELRFILTDCKPAALIAGRAEQARSGELARTLGIRDVLGLGEAAEVPAYEAVLAGAGSASAVRNAAQTTDPDLISLILYTSGTTGSPKGAMIDRQAFSHRVLVNCAELQVGPADVHLACLPMFHIAAFLAYAHTLAGGTVVMLPEFEPARVLAALAHEQVTTTVLVPTMISMLLDSPALHDFDLPSLRLIVYGGSTISPSLLRQALKEFGCGMHQQYGMTESGVQTILRPADHDPADTEGLSSAGTEAVSFEVRVVDAEDRPVGPGEIGEVVCCGPSVMSGYWNRPDATADTLRGGWLHTGDLGYRDGRGRLHITDRRNDMIVTGGENVYPREVEEVLLEHPEVTDVAVIGTPDDRWGQVVTAVLKESAKESAPADAELQAWARERLAGYKVPRRWVRLPQLPRNATGKVLKHELRAMLGS